jgi:hypothetical protein
MTCATIHMSRGVVPTVPVCIAVHVRRSSISWKAGGGMTSLRQYANLVTKST